MKKLKKIVSLLVAVAMLASMSVTSVFAYNDYETQDYDVDSISSTATGNAIYEDLTGSEKYYEAVQMLSKLSIFQGDNLGNFNPDKTITRAEAVAVILRMLGMDTYAQTKTEFVDVPATHWASGYIQTAESMGIVNGYGYGYFGPEDPVKYEQMLKMLVVALGYQPMIDYMSGTYPGTYVAAASQIGLSSNVGGSVGEPAYRKVVASLVYSALNAPLMEQISYGSNPEYAPMDGSSSARPLKTILNSKLDVYRVRAVVVQTSVSSIDSDSALSDGFAKVEVYDVQKGTEEIERDDVLYVEDAGLLKQYLGYPVVLYLYESDRSNADYEVLEVLLDETKFEEVVIEDVENIDIDACEGFGEGDGNAELVYYKNDGSRKTTYRIDKDASILINNMFEADVKDSSIDADIFDLEYGVVRLLDNNDDGKYDIINIKSYTTMVIGEINERYYKISDLNDVAPTITLDPEDEDISYTITYNGKEIRFEDLRVNDVLTIAANATNSAGYVDTRNATEYEILVSRDTLRGRVSGIYTEDGEDVYEINNKEYKVIDSCPSLSVSDEGTFYLDVFGTIAYFDVENTSSGQYGYILAAGVDSSYMDDTIEIKLMDKNGRVDIYETPTKGLTIYDEDGDKHTVKANATGSAEDFIDDGWRTEIVGAVVAYDTNASGAISKIYLAQGRDNDEDTFSLDRTLEEARYKEDTEVIGSVNVDSGTVVFFIPAGTRDEDDITVTTINGLEDDEFYDIKAYDLDRDMVAGLIVVDGSNDTVSIKKPIYVVYGVSSSTYEDDSIRDRLTAYYDGEKVSLYADEDTDLSDLDRGDVIALSTNAMNEITRYEVIVDLDETEIFDLQEFSSSIYDVEDLEFVYGFVVNKKNSSLAIGTDPDEMPEYIYAKKATVYRYDDRTGRFEDATLSDIDEYEDNEDMLVFARIFEGEVTDIVIYDNVDVIYPEISGGTVPTPPVVEEEEEEEVIPPTPEDPEDPEVPSETPETEETEGTEGTEPEAPSTEETENTEPEVPSTEE
jgi:hypothetical protein